MVYQISKGNHIESSSSEDKLLSNRYDQTLNIFRIHASGSNRILDLGIDNPFSDLMRKEGHGVVNTAMNQDLDRDFHQVKEAYDLVAAFQIFEYLVAPLNLLREIRAPKLMTSIPLKIMVCKSVLECKR